MTQERVSLPAGEALHVVYEQKFSGTTIATDQYAFFEDGAGYAVTVARR